MRIRTGTLVVVMCAVAGCWDRGPSGETYGPSPYADGAGTGSGFGYGGDVDAGTFPWPTDDGGPVDDWDSGAGDTDAGTGAQTDGCALHAYYKDADRDGFGDPTSAVLGCSAPAGYVADATDCYDNNPHAHPGQLSFFTTERGDGSYDYDCDGASTKELPSQDPKTCDCSAGTCAVSSGYRAAVPACGASADFAIGGEQPTCDATVVPVTQPCR